MISHHRLGAFGMKVNAFQTAPSSTCFVSCSNFWIGANNCRCQETPKEHVMDFNHRDGAITSIKQKLRVQIGQKVLIPAIHRHSGFLGSTPAMDNLALLGSTPAKTKRGKPVLAFPTDAKERQKIADKARKEAGIAKRTRKFVIEEHYDD